jgi:hypothetical protein
MEALVRLSSFRLTEVCRLQRLHHSRAPGMASLRSMSDTNEQCSQWQIVIWQHFEMLVSEQIGDARIAPMCQIKR